MAMRWTSSERFQLRKSELATSAKHWSTSAESPSHFGCLTPSTFVRSAPTSLNELNFRMRSFRMPIPSSRDFSASTLCLTALLTMCITRTTTTSVVAGPSARNSVNSRVDYHLRKHSLYLSGGINKGNIENPSAWGPDNPFYSIPSFIGRFVNDQNPYFSAGDTISFSPTLLVDVRYGLNRINTNNEAGGSGDFDYDQFGIPRSIQAISAAPGVPPVYEFGTLSNSFSLNKRERQTNHNFTVSTTKVSGRWTFKFGTEYRAYLSNYTDPEESFMFRTQGNLTQQFTSANGSPAGGAVTAEVAGNPDASLLTGAGYIYVAPGRSPKPALLQRYVALYSQNDWRATPKLTVNLGLRWDLQPGPTERFNRLSAFDFSQRNPFGTAGAYAFAGTSGYGRNYWDTRYKDFGPRVGLAYAVNDNLVVRAGYGITYLPTNTGYFATPGMYGMGLFSESTDFDLLGPNPAGVVVGSFDQVTRVVTPTGANPGAPSIYGVDAGGNWRFDKLDYRNGMVQQWNLFVERKVGSWLLSSGYAASKGDHLPFARVPLNSLQLVSPSLLDSWRAGYIASNGRNNSATAQVPNPFQPATGPLIPFSGNPGRATISQAEAAFAYPHFGGIQLQRSIGFSNYHAFQVGANRAFTNGLLVNAHYTWSKALDFTQTEAGTAFATTGGYIVGDIDLQDLKRNKKLSFTDVPHRFVASYVYELPLGPGKRFALTN